MSGTIPETDLDHNLFKRLTVASGVLLAVLVVGGLLLGSPRVAAGIAAGGVIALGNVYWLRQGIARAMGLEPRQAGRFALVRYLMRLAILAALLYLLLVKVGIDIIGLVIGLSVLVIIIIGYSLYRAAHNGG